MTETEKTTLPILKLAAENTEFRDVVKTCGRMQLVLMAIPEGGEIGGEIHEGHDQVLVFVEGEGRATIGDSTTDVQAGDLSFVPSGAFHNFVNTGTGMLKLYTLYAPPEHAPGTEHMTKAQADADEG